MWEKHMKDFAKHPITGDVTAQIVLPKEVDRFQMLKRIGTAVVTAPFLSVMACRDTAVIEVDDVDRPAADHTGVVKRQ